MSKATAREASRLAVLKRSAEAAAKRPTTTTTPPVLSPMSSAISPPAVDGKNVAQIATTNLTTVQIELLCSVRDEPTKKGLGYTFFSSGLTGEYGLAVVLNRNRILVSRALAKNDTVAVAFFYALLVAENLALRHHQSPLVAALQRTFRKQLYPEGFHPFQRFVDFATRLSLSPLFAPLKDLPIYGPAPTDKSYVVATIPIEVAPNVVARAPWQELSRRKK